jgi:hypothetical protein
MERKTHSEAFSDYLTGNKVVSLFRLPLKRTKSSPESQPFSEQASRTSLGISAQGKESCCSAARYA